jgi:hypothetical protein
MPHFDKNNSYFSGFQSIPPSRLGFVCKPDMPPHINILFRARPPLEFVPLPDKVKSRPYEGIFGLNLNGGVLEYFQKGQPEKFKPDESKRILRLKSIVENIEKHKADNKEKLKECKWLLNINYLCKRFFAYFYFLNFGNFRELRLKI